MTFPSVLCAHIAFTLTKWTEQDKGCGSIETMTARISLSRKLSLLSLVSFWMPDKSEMFLHTRTKNGNWILRFRYHNEIDFKCASLIYKYLICQRYFYKQILVHNPNSSHTTWEGTIGVRKNCHSPMGGIFVFPRLLSTWATHF